MQCAACVTQEGEANVTTFENEETLRSHIALQHAFRISFECSICRMTLLPTQTALKQHYVEIHPRTVPKAIYTYEEEKKNEMQRILTSSMTPSHTDTFKSVRSCEKIELQRGKVSNKLTRPPHGSSFITSDQRQPVNIDTFAFENTSTALRNYSPNKKDDEDRLVEMEPVNESNNDSDKEDEMNSSIFAEKRMKAVGVPEKAQVQGKEQTERLTCKLCPRSVTTKSLHIWKYHLSCKRYECDTCDYDTIYLQLIRKHAAEKHAQSGICWTDKMNLLKRDYILVLTKAFGGSDETNSGRFSRQSENGGEEVHLSKCKLCNTKLNDRTTHIWTHHIEPKRYRCMLCPYGEQLLDSMKTHASHNHSEEEGDCWSDHNQELSDHFRETYFDAFGPHKEKLPRKHRVVIERNGKKISIEKKRDQKVVCNICRKETHHDHKSNHIWMWHTKEKRFACTMCDYTVAHKRTAMYHAGVKHNCADAGLCITDRRLEMIEEHDRALLTAFGESTASLNRRILSDGYSK